MRTSITLAKAAAIITAGITASALSADLSATSSVRIESSKTFTTGLKVWDTPEWKNCFEAFRRTVKPAMFPKEQRLIEGKCVPAESSPRMADGSCIMEAVSPSDLLSATDFEVKLVCMSGSTEVMVCTNKKGHYMPAMTSHMPNDRRCEGFPNLLAANMSKKGPNKALQHIFKDRKPNSEACVKQLKIIRRLENDPRFDQNRSIRQHWSEQVAVGTKMGCDFSKL